MKILNFILCCVIMFGGIGLYTMDKEGILPFPAFFIFYILILYVIIWNFARWFEKNSYKKEIPKTYFKEGETIKLKDEEWWKSNKFEVYYNFVKINDETINLDNSYVIDKSYTIDRKSFYVLRKNNNGNVIPYFFNDDMIKESYYTKALIPF